MGGYKYGVYGDIGNTVAQNALQATETIVYIGTAPINLVRGFDSDLVNKPIRVTGKSTALRRVGYSKDWVGFTLSEAIAAHFDNALTPIGPIVLINVLDPAIHKKSSETTVELQFAAGKAEIVSDTIIIDSLALDSYVEGGDYELEYNYQKGAVVITSIATPITGSVTASYSEVDPSLVTHSDIIGEATADGAYSGIQALTLVNSLYDLVPSIVLAPTWSEIPEVYNALISAVRGIGGHWLADVYADIPVSTLSDTITKALSWKAANGYVSEDSKVFWPQGKKGGMQFHLSTLAAVTRLYTDYQNGGIPYESPANKQVDVDELYTGEGARMLTFDQAAANLLTQKGITTSIRFGGIWRMWGDHTAAYDYDEATNDPRSAFDINMSMLKYIVNDFQVRFLPDIDSPLDKNRVESILASEQEMLDGLKARGALVGEPRCFFLEESNDPDDIQGGRFRWDVTVTATPPLKAASVSVAYTDAGFSAIFE